MLPFAEMWEAGSGEQIAEENQEFVLEHVQFEVFIR